MIINNILFLRNRLYRQSHNEDLIVENRFAKMIGVPQGNWSNWRNNRRTPSQTKVLQRICNFFNEKLNMQLTPDTLKLVDLQAEWEKEYSRSFNIPDKFKRCPIQPTPSNGILCESCQHCISIEPCQARLKEERKANTIPVCIPLYKPPRRLSNGKWQDIYPILERTTPGGKPIENELIKEKHLDTEFKEVCNLYLSIFTKPAMNTKNNSL